MTKTDTPPPALERMYAKLGATGPLALDDDETAALRLAFQELLYRVAQLEATDRVNIAIAQALGKQGLELARDDHPDGTMGWKLQPVVPETVN